MDVCMSSKVGNQIRNPTHWPANALKPMELAFQGAGRVNQEARGQPPGPDSEESVRCPPPIPIRHGEFATRNGSHRVMWKVYLIMPEDD